MDTTDDDTVIFYEDEAIITDEPTTTGRWAPVRNNMPGRKKNGNWKTHKVYDRVY